MKEKPPIDTLWAPWRVDYILGPKEKGCIFCNRYTSEDDKESLILYRGDKSFVIMNRYPYNSGHLMVLPFRHVANINDLDEAESCDLMGVLKVANRVLESVMKPHGMNVGINLGDAAGAGVAAHLHVHIIPRWNGDTNFMPVIGDTRIISESLDRTYDKLKIAFDNEG